MKKSMEITYFGANYLITSKNEQQNEIRKEIPAENGPELVYQRCLYSEMDIVIYVSYLASN